MNDTHPDELFDPQKGLPPGAPSRGDVASGTATGPAEPTGSDSPTEGTVPGPLAPEPEPDTELRPHPEND